MFLGILYVMDARPPVHISTRLGVVCLLAAFLFAGLTIGPSLRSDAEAQSLQDFLAGELEDTEQEWVSESRNQFDNNGPAGRLSIPGLGFDQVFGTGVTLPDLRSGASWAPQSAVSGEGQNVALAGHRNGWGGPFADLDLVANGDPISLAWATGAEANYEVSSVEIVDPDQVQHIMPDPKGDGETLTLITCHPPGTVEQRLIVTAELVDLDLTDAHQNLLSNPIGHRIAGDASATTGETEADFAEEISANRPPAPTFSEFAAFLFPLVVIASLSILWFSSRRSIVLAGMIHVISSVAIAASFSL